MVEDRHPPRAQVHDDYEVGSAVAPFRVNNHEDEFVSLWLPS